VTDAKMIVTGSSGFIGTAVLSELKNRNLGSVALSRSASESGLRFDFERDSADELFRRIKPGSILHLGWQGIPDLSEATSLKNLDLSRRFLLSAIKAGAKRIVLAGSCLEYGELSGEVREGDLPASLSPFGRIKRELYSSILDVAESAQCQVLNGRIFYAYGPGQRENSLVPFLFRTLLSGEVPTLRSPDAAQDFIEVSDVASALIELCTNPSAETGNYNIGSGKLIPVKRVASVIARLLGQNTDSELGIEPKGVFANIDRLRDLGWTPKFSIEEGLKRYVLHQNAGEIV
jgi:nucleoside-diphosphate-sugar epimerase